MKNISPLLVLLGSLASYSVWSSNHVPSGEEFLATPNDAASNEFQEQIDEGNVSDGQAHKIIDNGDFDLQDGGLYCPNDDCEADPEDVSNGF